MSKVENASIMPRRYFGLHMAEGVAEYKEADGNSYRVFINADTIKRMDKTFDGLPVFVNHTEDVSPKDIHKADGYVVKSFYNQVDGKHWVEFLITSDRGHDAIAKGWKLSNAYFPLSFANGGHWHGVEYGKQVMEGKYEHLAIVNNPRYAESVVLTPEQFKEYNDKKAGELKKLSNSQGAAPMFKFWKREKIENSVDVENTMVLLPESKKELTIAEALKSADKFENMAGYASPDHMVKVGNEEMSVKKLADSFSKLSASIAEDEEKKKKENEDSDEGDDKKKKKENEDKDEDKDEKKKDKKENKKKSNESDEAGDDDKSTDEHFKKLQNAEANAPKPTQAVVDTEKVSRGKARYGSGK